ncbi:hypothetical protein AB0H79_09750 [Micrococcus luteus]|uniref:hypothetical protein n=1 Tax=Micrococcus luteus TaxID=1270 RepID=UPI00340F2BF4
MSSILASHAPQVPAQPAGIPKWPFLISFLWVISTIALFFIIPWVQEIPNVGLMAQALVIMYATPLVGGFIMAIVGLVGRSKGKVEWQLAALKSLRGMLAAQFSIAVALLAVLALFVGNQTDSGQEFSQMFLLMSLALLLPAAIVYIPTVYASHLYADD